MVSPTTDRRFGLVGNVAVKAPVDLAVMTNLTLSSEQTIQSVTTSESRVLVAGQTDATENGIYKTSSSAWVRDADADGTYDLKRGTVVLATQGAYAGAFFEISSANPITIGTSEIAWEQIQGPGTDFDSTVSYDYTTTNGFVRAQDVSVFNYIPRAYQQAILAGTSTQDVSTYIAQAITAAAARSPARVVFPPGKYKASTVLGSFLASNVTVEGNGATIDASGVQIISQDYFLQFTGTYSGTPVTLSSNAAASQKTVACVSSTFAVGDMVRVYSEAIFDSTRTNTAYGELNWIETVPNAFSVTLTNELAASYLTADTAKIQKVTPCENIVIRNLRLLGPGPNDILFAQRHTLCTNILIENVKSFDWDITHCQLIDCAKGKVQNCHFEESNATATGYGLSFKDATQDCVAQGNTFTNVRHSLSTNNTTAGGHGVTRRIKFQGNNVTDSATTIALAGGDAIDTHAGCEDIEILDNTVFSSSGNGINAEGRAVTIRGNQVFNSTGNGITYQNYTDQAGEADISNNRVRGVAGNYGIVVTTQAATIRSLTMNGNNVKTNIRPFQVSGQALKLINKVSATGNVGVTGVANNAAVFEYCNYLGMSGGAMQSLTVGIVLENCSYCAITGVPVEITGTGALGRAIRLQGTGEGNTVIGCPLVHSGTIVAATAIDFVDTTITNSTMALNSGKDFNVGTVFNKGTGTGNVETLDIDY